ncbi:MAG: hypothetical protein U0103_29905 [Candidatus Obscuribacterales bacterium]
MSNQTSNRPGTAGLFQEHIRIVLAALGKSRIMYDVVAAFGVLKASNSDWANGERQKEVLERLEKRWAKRLTSAVLNEGDIADARFLLLTFPSDVTLSLPAADDIQSSWLLDEIRYAAVAIAGWSWTGARISNFLRVELYDASALLESVFNECWLVKKGAQIERYEERTAAVVVAFLQVCLEENSVQGMLFQFDDRIDPLDRVRFALIAVLARAACLACQRITPAK